MNLIEMLPILREAGFFKSYAARTDSEIMDALHQLREEEAARCGADYKARVPTDIKELLAQDTQKCIYLDLEADVYYPNKVYAYLLQLFGRASDGQFNPTHMEEVWEGEEGPIKVGFNVGNRRVVFEPEYVDDWMDTVFFEVVNREMKKSGEAKFWMYNGTNGDSWGGQNVYIMRLTPEEIKLLNKAFGWNFG